jgi:hypothetical protein
MNKIVKIFNLAILFVILGGGIFSFISLAGNQSSQFIVGVVTSIAYALWGIFYHSYEGNLHRKVVVEYLLIAAIAIMVLVVVMRS